MKIRKLLLPALVASLLAVPVVYAQSADAADKDDARRQAASKADADKAGDAEADARKEGKQDTKGKAAKKGAKARTSEEQPDEPEEDGR